MSPVACWQVSKHASCYRCYKIYFSTENNGDGDNLSKSRGFVLRNFAGKTISCAVNKITDNLRVGM